MENPKIDRLKNGYPIMYAPFFRHLRYDQASVDKFAKFNAMLLRQERESPKAKKAQKVPEVTAPPPETAPVEMVDKSTFIRMPDRSMFPLSAFEIQEEYCGLQFCKADFFEDFL